MERSATQWTSSHTEDGREGALERIREHTVPEDAYFKTLASIRKEQKEVKRNCYGFLSLSGGQTQPSLTVAHKECLKVSFNMAMIIPIDKRENQIFSFLCLFYFFFLDPFGGDPFKGSDPFASDCFFKQTSTDPFTTSSTDPFSASSNSSNTSVSGRIQDYSAACTSV